MKVVTSLGILKFEFEPVHPSSGMSLRMMLMSMHSTLHIRFSGSIPLVMTQVGYLGRRGFKLILQCRKLLLHVLSSFSDKFAFHLCKSWNWLVTTTIQPTTHVPQTNCLLLLMCSICMHVHLVYVCKAVAPSHSWKVTEL